MTREEKEQTGKYMRLMTRLFVDGSYQQEMLLKAAHIIDEALEQEPILDKIRAEIKDTLYVDSLIFGELIDFKNGKIDADNVIEEFNRVTRLEVLKIIDKHRTESEK